MSTAGPSRYVLCHVCGGYYPECYGHACYPSPGFSAPAVPKNSYAYEYDLAARIAQLEARVAELERRINAMENPK